MQIKILSYNIHKGFDWVGKKLIIQKIKQAIIDCRADLVFLQEIVGENKSHEEQLEDWPKGSQLEYLADTIWPEYAYAKNAIYTEGHYGNAILSKFPILTWDKQDISTNRWEQRGLLYCNIEIPACNFSNFNDKRILHAYCLHLDLFHKGRKKQYQALYNRIKQEVQMGEPVIVAGDFNDWNKKSKDIFEDGLQMREVFKTLKGDYAKTFPAKLPILQLDRIYSKNLELQGGSIYHREPWKDLSDHAPLYAEFNFLD